MVYIDNGWFEFILFDKIFDILFLVIGDFMNICKDCDELTIICDFCKYSRVANEYETEELLWCNKYNYGVDVCNNCEDFHCVYLNREEIK